MATMIPADYQALIVALLAIVPGFLATTFWSRTKTWRGRSPDLLTVIQSLAASAVIQVVMAPLTLIWLYPERNVLIRHPWHVFIWLLLTVLIIPIASGVAAARLSDIIFNPASPWIKGRPRRILAWIMPPAPPPSIWDWLFTANVPDGCFLVVEFADNTRVAGVFARGSTALTSPQPQGVFLSREWSLDAHGDLVAEVPHTAGVMITNSTAIRTVRILRP